MLLFMLVNTSSMFEINILVAIVVMLNILELIMELLPNYLTIRNLIIGNFLSYQWLVLLML